MANPDDVRRRAAGSLLGMAVGDALGAPYEFGGPPGIRLTGTAADMVGGGALGWAPGEWTDDTSMAIPLLRALAATAPGLEDAGFDAVVEEWRDWASDARDVGVQTRELLSMLSAPASAADARAAALQVHRSRGRSGGNGSLMRTGPVGVVGALRLWDAELVATLARSASELTHWDPEAGDACVLWSVMIYQAGQAGVADVDAALALVPAERRALWAGRLEDATYSRPIDFPENGWVVHALQAAWAAIHRAGIDPAEAATATPLAFRVALQHAINAGSDTDTVAAIAGALAGALCGADAIPADWLEVLHGWGGRGSSGAPLTIRAANLLALAGVGPV